MPALLVSKSPPLSGELTVHGAKNSVLPILAATLLCRTPCVLHNCPDILDVTHALDILRSLGCACERRGTSIYIDPRASTGVSIPQELAGSMRASSLFLGALLARAGEALLSLPGGCPIGARPMDYHLLAFRALGAEVVGSNADFCARFLFAPRYPIWLKLWFGDEELPASGRLLLDTSAPQYLTIEDAVTAGTILLDALTQESL